MTHRHVRSRTTLRAAAKVATLILIPAGAAGCSHSLETGYTPRPLGVTTAERRGYYASPYTPEAAAAAQTRSDPGAENRDLRRPNVGPRPY